MKNRFQSGFGPLSLASFLTLSGTLIVSGCSDAPDTSGLGQTEGGGGGGAIPGMAPTSPLVPGDPSVQGPGTPPPVTPGDPAVPPGDPSGTPPTPVNPDPGVTPPAGAAGAPSTATCSNADMTVLPIDATGWVARECNAYGMQGAWYCYDDGVNPSGCVADTPPYVANEGMCLTGSTTLDPTYAAWGAGLGIALNDSGMTETTASVKSAYNAAMNGVTGFNIELTGDSGGLPIRINFTNAADTTGTISPFVQVPGVGSYEVMLADALVPVAWMVPESGTTADPNGIFDVQVQIVGGDVAANYHVCVTSMTPISDGTVGPSPTPSPAGTLANYGSPVCDNFAEIALGNQYMVQNNSYNGATHCIQAMWDNATNVGFSLSGVSANAPNGGAPASYPSIVYGWHVNGNFYGAYQTAKQISAIASAPSSWSFTVPGAGRYNASYDNWIHSQAAPGNESGSLEHMIWLNYRDATPIGTNVATAMLGGTTWEVWYGPNNGWNTVTYRRATNTTSVSGLDLKEFLDDSVTRGYAAASDYLLGVQAGFEIWEANSEYATQSFSVSVN